MFGDEVADRVGPIWGEETTANSTTCTLELLKKASTSPVGGFPGRVLILTTPHC